METRLYVKCETIPQPVQHVHNKPAIDTQQKNYNTHKKARIPATISQQHDNKSTITVSQQLYNRFTTSPRLLHHCHGLVEVLLWNDFHIKLKLSSNKFTTFTTCSQPYQNQALRQVRNNPTTITTRSQQTCD